MRWVAAAAHYENGEPGGFAVVWTVKNGPFKSEVGQALCRHRVRMAARPVRDAMRRNVDGSGVVTVSDDHT